MISKLMKFDEYLKIITQKVNPESAFSLARDARLKALENILIEKEIATKSEIDSENERQLGEIAQTVMKLPPIPEELTKKDE